LSAAILEEKSSGNYNKIRSILHGLYTPLKSEAMKIKQFFYSILFLMPTFLLAQKMVSVDNRWYFYDLSPPKYYSVEFAAFFKDSVEVNGHFYYQLYRTVDSAYRHVEPSKVFYREEKGIVYRLNNSNNSEDTIYNFDLKLGQSIAYDRPDVSPTYQTIAIVYSVDTVKLLDGSKRRKISVYNPRFLSGGYYIRSFIEGIGNIELGTFAPEQIFDNVGVVFRCFYQKGQYIFGNHEGRCRDIYQNFPLSVSKIEELKNLKLIQHTGNGTIAFHLENVGNYSCKVYNALGATLFAPVVRQGFNQISVTDLPKGVYFVQVNDIENRRQKTLKLVH
jgi:hypothetical protein